MILLRIKKIWLNQRFFKLDNWKMIGNILQVLRMKNYKIIFLKWFQMKARVMTMLWMFCHWKMEKMKKLENMIKDKDHLLFENNFLSYAIGDFGGYWTLKKILWWKKDLLKKCLRKTVSEWEKLQYLLQNVVGRNITVMSHR